jgi:FkbM family methyltransferase
MANYCARLLAWYRPDCICLGLSTEFPDDPGNAAIIIHAPDWRSTLEALPGALASRAILFPLALGEAHHYTNFFNIWERETAGTEAVFSPHDMHWFKRTMVEAYRVAAWTSATTITFLNLPCLSDRPNFFDLVVFGRPMAELLNIITSRLADYQSTSTIRSLLFDDQEQQIYQYARTVSAQLQYFDLVELRSGELFINVGVMRGDELPVLSALLGGRGSVICFDPMGYDKLTDYAQRAIAEFPGLFVLESAGLENQTTTTRFLVLDGVQASGMLVGADIGDDVQHVESRLYRLDDYRVERGLDTVTFIKMDIEGGEIEALMGMSETIRLARPVLAIAIYHRSTDFVIIPLMVMSMCDNYDFYIRTYGWHSVETILYAVPKERPLGTPRHPDTSA